MFEIAIECMHEEYILRLKAGVNPTPVWVTFESISITVHEQPNAISCMLPTRCEAG